MKWTYKGKTPAGGKLYHKKDDAMIVYNNKIRLFRKALNAVGETFPCCADDILERRSGKTKKYY